MKLISQRLAITCTLASILLISACQNGDLNKLEEELAVGGLDIRSITVSAEDPVFPDAGGTIPIMPTNETQQFIVMGTHSDGSESDVTQLITSWSTSDPALATITTDGLLTSKSTAGNVNVTAVLSGLTTVSTISISSAVLDTIVIEDELASSPVTMSLCSQIQLLASGVYKEGGTTIFDGWDLTDKVSWNSTEGDFSQKTAGLFSVVDETLSPAIANVTAELAPATTPGQLAINVDITNFTDILMSPSTFTLTIGSEKQFTATAVRTTGGGDNITDIVTWDSNDPSIATVDNGLVKGVSEGNNVQISALCGDVGPGIAVVEVIPQSAARKIERIEIENKGGVGDEAFHKLDVGGDLTLRAIAIYSNGDEERIETDGNSTWHERDIQGVNIVNVVKSSDVTVTAVNNGVSEVYVIYDDGTVKLEDDVVVRVGSGN